MAQQGLNDAQVGAAPQQGRGKRVAQCVGRNGLVNAGQFGLTLNHDEYHHAREMVAASVQKHVVFLARLDVHLAAVVKPEVELVQGTVGNGHQPLLVALAQHADEPFLGIETREAQVGEFGHTQSAGEQNLDDGTVAMALVGRKVDTVFQCIHLGRSEIFGQVARQMGRLQQLRGVHLQVAVEHQIAVESPHAAEDACLRLGPDAALVERGGKMLQVFQLHFERPQPLRAEIAEQVGQVVTIGLQRVIGVVALQLQVAHIAANHVVHGMVMGCFHGLYRDAGQYRRK